MFKLPQFTPIGSSSAAVHVPEEKQRFSNIPDEYRQNKFLPDRSAEGQSFEGTPSPTARFANLSSFLGGGQYTQDSTQPNRLLKSTRDYTPDLNNQLAGGRIFRSNVEIDHKIPLWIGGTDTPENKLALSIPEHDTKTKQNAVIQALYYNGQMGAKEALQEAINWQGKDTTGIKLGPTGQISLEDAKKKYEEWKKPADVSMSDVLKTWGKKLGSFATFGKYKGEPNKDDVGEQLYAKALGEGSRGVVGQFAQGVGSGATFGYLPAEGNKDETLKEAVARGAGNIAGTLINFSWLGKLAGLAAKGIWGSTKVGTTGKTVAKLPAWLEKLRKTEVVLKGGKTFSAGKELTSGTNVGKALATLKKAKDFGEIVVPKNAAFNAIMGAGLFTLHGQLSKQQENDFQGRVKRFLSDAAFGAMLSLPTKSLKAAKSARYAENLKQSAYLGAGVYVLSSLEGADAGEALLNSAIIVGLHGVGLVGYKKKMDPFLNKVANNERIKWGLKPIVGESKLTEESAKKELASVLNRIMSESNTPAEGAKNLNALVTANRQLYKGGLSRERRLIEDIKDMESIVQRTNKLNEGQLDGVPDNVTTIFNALRDGVISKKNIDNAILKQPIGPPRNLGNGLFAGTGFASTADPIKNKNLIEYSKAREEAIANGTPFDETLIIERVTDPKELEFYRIKSENSDTPFDPNTVLNVYGLLNGKKTYLATVPMNERLNRPVTGIRASQMRAGLTPDMIPAENMHNETLIKLMEERGVNTLTAKAKYTTPIAKISNEPFLNFTIADEDWIRAQAIKELLNKDKSEKISESIVRRPVPVEKPFVIEEAPGQGTILNTISQKYGDESEFFAMQVDSFRELLSEKNPKIFAKNLSNLYGVKISVDNAAKIIEDAENKTVGDFLNFLYNASLKGELNESGKVMLNNIISDGYFKGLSNADKNDISELKILAPGPKPIDSERTGEIEQKIELDKTTGELSRENIAPPVVGKQSPTPIHAPSPRINPTITVKTTGQPEKIPTLSSSVAVIPAAISRRPGRLPGTEWIGIGPKSPSRFAALVSNGNSVELLVSKGAGATGPIKNNEHLGRAFIDGKEYSYKELGLEAGNNKLIETAVTKKPVEKVTLPKNYINNENKKLAETISKSKKMADKRLMNGVSKHPAVKKAAEIAKVSGKKPFKVPKKPAPLPDGYVFGADGKIELAKKEVQTISKPIKKQVIKEKPAIKKEVVVEEEKPEEFFVEKTESTGNTEVVDEIAKPRALDIESSKKPSFREFEDGINTGLSKLIKNPENIKKITRDELTALAKKIYKEDKVDEGLSSYIKAIEKIIRKDINNPKFKITNKDDLRDIKWSFNNLASSARRKKFVLNKSDSVARLEDGDLNNTGQIERKIQKFVKENNLPEDSIDIINVDKDIFYGKHQYGDSRNKFRLNNTQLSKMKEGNYIPIVITKKGVENVLYIKVSPELAKLVDKNPSRYLDKGEQLTSLEDKFIRAFAVDVIGLPKDISAGDFVKRGNLLFHRYDRPFSESNKQKVNINIIEAKSVKDEPSLYPDKDMFENSESDMVNNSIESFKEGQIIDGKIFIGEKLFDYIVEASGYNPKKFKTGLKPLINTEISAKGAKDLQLLVQKGHAIKLDTATRKMLAEDYDVNFGKIKDNGEMDIFSFDSNTKIGPKKGSYEMPINDIYLAPLSVGEGRMTPSTENKFISSDVGVTRDMTRKNKKELDDFMSLNDDIETSVGAEEFINVLESHLEKYNIDPVKAFSATEGVRDAFKAGAGRVNLKHQIDKILKNIFLDNVFTKKMPNSARVFISSDIKLDIDGNGRRYLKDDEIVLGSDFMKKRNIKEGETVLVLRDPSYGIGNILYVKAINGDKLGHTSLGNEHGAVSLFNERIRLGGDQDADTMLIMKIGEGGVSKSYADAVKKRGNKAIPFTEVKMADPLPLTAKNIKKVIERQLVGDDQTAQVAKTLRRNEALIDNDISIRSYGGGKFEVLSGKTVVDSNMKTEGDVSKADVYSPKNEFNERQLIQQALQEAVDSKKSEDIIDRTEDNNFQWSIKQIFVDNKTGEKISNKQAREVSDALKTYDIMYNFKKMLEADTTMNKVLNDAAPFFKLLENIKKSGGKLTPLQEKLLSYKDIEPTVYGTSFEIIADSLGVKTVKEEIKDVNLFRPKVSEFRKIAAKAKAEYLAVKNDNPNQKKIRKEIRKKVTDYFDSNLREGNYTNKDVEAIAYWAAAEKEANMWHGTMTDGSFYAKPTAVLRYRKLINASDRVSDAYYRGSEKHTLKDQKEMVDDIESYIVKQREAEIPKKPKPSASKSQSPAPAPKSPIAKEKLTSAIQSMPVSKKPAPLPKGYVANRYGKLIKKIKE